MNQITLNSEQQSAVDHISQHILENSGGSLVLKAPAGCGKSTCMSFVLDQVQGKRIAATAPTNKAVKVLSEMVGDRSHTTCTIHKLLGLQLLPSGEVKRISGKNRQTNFQDLDGIIVDEAGMLNKELMGYIEETGNENPHLTWTFVGDAYQLPPVMESHSKVWEIADQIELKRVMRTDNQILTLATRVRNLIAEGSVGALDLREDFDDRGGVYKPAKLLDSLLEDAEGLRTGEAKGVAWRNATVQAMNFAVRNVLLPDDWHRSSYWPTDRITLLEPARNTRDELLGATDDEFVIQRVEVTHHPIFCYLTIYKLFATSEFSGAEVEFWVLHESSKEEFDKRLKALALAAKQDPRGWATYWNFKECVHYLRHGYAVTAHKSQGSTYQRAYVNWRDIMLNPRREEALRCLYVAVSRPKHKLYVG